MLKVMVAAASMIRSQTHQGIAAEAGGVVSSGAGVVGLAGVTVTAPGLAGGCGDGGFSATGASAASVLLYLTMLITCSPAR